MNLSNFITELKRRNVFRVATAYAIAGWLVIQICATTFPYLNLPDWIITTVIIVVIAGFPISFIIAWIFEYTTEGIKKSTEVDITESVTRTTSRKLNILIISVLSLAILFLVVERVFFAKDAFLEEISAAQAQVASVAVLPFSDLSANADQEYFADGLSEELLNALAKVNDLKVAGRTTSFKFKGQNDNLRLIGEELQVNHVLEGSVRKSGNRIRITAQLTKVDDGFNLWSENFDRELTAHNIFDIQEEIALEVLSQLKILLLPETETMFSGRPTQDIEAYNLYLEATQLEPNRKKEELEAAIEKYKAAIRLDPSFAEAYARLAYAYHLLFNYGSLEREDLISLMKENIDQALLLNVNLGRAYHALAYYYRYTGEYDESLEASKRAIKLMPNDAKSYVALRNAYFYTGQWEQVKGAMKKAYELDPDDPAIANMYARDLIGDGEVIEAGKILDNIIQRYPDFSPAVGQKARIYRDVSYGRIDLAFQLVYNQYMLDRNDITNLTEVLNVSTDLGITGLEDDFIERIEAINPQNQTLLFQNISRYSSRGNFRELLNILEPLLNDSLKDNRLNYDLINASLLFRLDEYEKALVILKEESPDLFLKAPVLDLSRLVPAMMANVILRSKGDDLQADLIAKKICEQIEEYSNTEEDESRVLEAMVICNIATQEYDQAVNNIETFYFVNKSKSNMLEYLNGSEENQALKSYPEYTKLKSRILSDIKVMRMEVINYLKAEGEWKEEWEDAK